MLIYLVGGAVRDELLNRPVKDRDWVVVGATPQDMVNLGYTQVGADFPVFLSPDSKEEYALARQERKTGPGYHGFETHIEPDVTLEDDLFRRDVTINAMAKDAEGNIIDPFNGQQDLKDGILRHVSQAFGEDPVRVLRVARFAARYNFSVHPDTMRLMKNMVDDGELNHLTAERVWSELERAMGEKHPTQFFWVLENCGAIKVLFPELKRIILLNGRAMNRLSLINGSVQQQFMALCRGRDVDDIKVMMDRVKAPNNIKTLTLKYIRFMERMVERKVDPEVYLKLMNELDLFRHPGHIDIMAMTAIISDNSENVFYFLEAFKQAQDITFATLSERQQQMLRGSDIGKAIDGRRLKVVKKILRFK